MKQRHRVRAALGVSAALAAGAGIALASVPSAQQASQPVTQKPVSATYATASAELARLRAQLSGSAQDTVLLRSLITRLQHEVDAAQARLEQMPRVGRAARSSGAVPSRPTRPKSTTVSTRSHHSPSPPVRSPSDDDGSGDD